MPSLPLHALHSPIMVCTRLATAPSSFALPCLPCPSMPCIRPSWSVHGLQQRHRRSPFHAFPAPPCPAFAHHGLYTACNSAIVVRPSMPSLPLHALHSPIMVCTRLATAPSSFA